MNPRKQPTKDNHNQWFTWTFGARIRSNQKIKILKWNILLLTVIKFSSKSKKWHNINPYKSTILKSNTKPKDKLKNQKDRRNSPHVFHRIHDQNQGIIHILEIRNHYTRAPYTLNSERRP